MKTFFATLAAILVATAIILSALFVLHEIGNWATEKERAERRFLDALRERKIALALLNNELRDPAAALQNLSVFDLETKRTMLKIYTAGVARESDNAREAGATLKSIITNKPFLPLSDADENELVDIDNHLGRTSEPQQPPVVVTAPTTRPTTSPKRQTSASIASLRLTQDVELNVPYGKTILHRGTELQIRSRPAAGIVRVIYLDHEYDIPASATDL